MKTQNIKDLYTSGKTVSSIAQILHCTRATVYNAKNKASKAGDDWDALALVRTRSGAEVLKSEKEFINVLLNEFERGFNELSHLEPKERLELLERYTNSYYKLKAPQKEDKAQNKYNVITATIKSIAGLATKQNNAPVLEFLSTNANEIIGAVGLE